MSRLIDADELEPDAGYIDGEFLAYSLAQIEMAPTIHLEPEWIPVSPETLPDKGRVVVVCGEKGTWDYGTYRGHGDDIHFWHWKKNTYKHVYWWMYKEDALALPWKEEE